MQITQVLRFGSRAAQQLFALGVGGIAFGALPVFFGKAPGLEVSARGQNANEFRRVIGDLRHGDHRQLGANVGALGGVVIEEYEAVQPEVQSARHRLEVVHLVLPVGEEGGKIVQCQDRSFMPVEGQPRILFVVLAADGQKNSALLQLATIPLQCLMGLAAGVRGAKLDAPEAIFANHTSPQRIVQVEDEHFLCQAKPGADQCQLGFGESRKGLVGRVLLGQIPRAVILPALSSEVGRYLGLIENGDLRRRHLGQPKIQFPQNGLPAPAESLAQGAKGLPGREVEIMLDDPARLAAYHGVPLSLQTVQDPLHGGLRIAAQSGEIRVAPLVGEQNESPAKTRIIRRSASSPLG